MRDPDRILLVLGEVYNVWIENPDLRLTQLLWNMRTVHKDLSSTASDFYNMEDDELVQRLLGKDLT